MIDDFEPRRVKSNTPPRLPTRADQPSLLKSEDGPTLDTPQIKDGAPQNLSPSTGIFTPPAESFNKKRSLRHWRPTKKQIVISSSIFLLLGISSLVTGIELSHTPTPHPQVIVPPAKITPPPAKPTTLPSRLTGLPIAPEDINAPVTGVMIENSPFARPQSGLMEAGVVFEAVAEGGITRFLSLYEDNLPSYVGPVRSVRPYYLQWLLPFDSSLAHVGGSPDALNGIKVLGVKDLDQFYNAGSYQRIKDREAPHNVYTNIGQLVELEKKKGFDKSTFTGFPRKTDAPSATPNAKSIDFTISGPIYSVHYDYDVATNTYKRSEGGAPHNDKSGTQLAPKVVIAMVVSQNTAIDGLHTVYGTTGSGLVYIYQDGIVTKGTWNKTDSKSQLSFLDSNGQPIALNAGQTWISVVGLNGDVSSK
ncbi:MAG: hypothetical protein NVSMB46_07880 [Candidatus Saccharimonadales bacterium]